MDSEKKKPEAAEPAWGPIRDLHRLKSDGAASLAELQEFLAKMKGRRPEEVLGMVSGSRLVQSMVWGTLLCLGLMAVLTVGPWMLADQTNAAKPKTAQKTTQKSAAPQKPADDKDAPASADAPAKTAKSAGKSTGSEKVLPADAEKAVKVMGLGETKTADPKKMEDRLENLLDKVE